jgi:hypothetical protein
MEPFNVESLVRDELQRMEPYAPIISDLDHVSVV